AHDVVLTWLEGLAGEHGLAVLTEDVGDGRAGGEHEAQPAIWEDALHAGGELMPVDRKVEPGLVLPVSRRDPSIREHRIDAEVAGVVGHVVDTAVTEVREDVGRVEARHGDLADTHLQERGEGREDALLPRGRAEARGGREVAALHDATPHEDLRM